MEDMLEPKYFSTYELLPPAKLGKRDVAGTVRPAHTWRIAYVADDGQIQHMTAPEAARQNNQAASRGERDRCEQQLTNVCVHA